MNGQVLDMVPTVAARILDLGCGTGVFGRAIKDRQQSEVIGVTYNQEEADLASQGLDRVLVADLNEFDPSTLGRFDVVVCSHVLEHLYHPGDLLARLKPCLEGGGMLAVALPNVLF